MSQEDKIKEEVLKEMGFIPVPDCSHETIDNLGLVVKTRDLTIKKKNEQKRKQVEELKKNSEIIKEEISLFEGEIDGVVTGHEEYIYYKISKEDLDETFEDVIEKKN